MKKIIDGFLLKVKILTLFALVIFLHPRGVLATEIEAQKYQRKHPILDKKRNIKEILEMAQEAWLRGKFSQEMKQVFIDVEDIMVEEGGRTWISANGELTDFPEKVGRKEIMVEEKFPFLEFKQYVPNIDLRQSGIILTFLNKENHPIGAVKMFMLAQEQLQKPKEKPFQLFIPTSLIS